MSSASTFALAVHVLCFWKTVLYVEVLLKIFIELTLGDNKHTFYRWTVIKYDASIKLLSFMLWPLNMEQADVKRRNCIPTSHYSVYICQLIVLCSVIATCIFKFITSARKVKFCFLYYIVVLDTYTQILPLSVSGLKINPLNNENMILWTLLAQKSKKINFHSCININTRGPIHLFTNLTVLLFDL